MAIRNRATGPGNGQQRQQRMADAEQHARSVPVPSVASSTIGAVKLHCATGCPARAFDTESMKDLPCIVLAATVWAYWACVGAMTIRVRRRTRKLSGIVPSQGVEQLMWVVWVPLVVALDARETMLALPGAGFVTLSVIDAEGRSARAEIRVR